MYNTSFYKNRHQQTVYSAKKIISLIEPTIPEIHSAVDIGCGVGTWLSVLKEKGVDRIQGIDGSWVDKTYLQIPKECFLEHDLSQKIELSEKFDLAISLEVAEHLPSSSASDFVDSLTKLSDFVLFSAAIPFQGGVGHINEQWPSYWIALFEKRGYTAVDLIRRRIWDDRHILMWYKQNILLFVHTDRKSELKLDSQIEDFVPLEVYCNYYNQLISPTIKQSLKLLSNAIKKSMQRRLK
jgi:SAM-dependent methyltransferase